MRGGFTLIELMVAVSIIVIITTVLLLRQDQFNSTTLLRSLAYSVALSIRQAQAYGTSVRETELGSGFFAPSYAIYFRANNATQYYLAADRLPVGAPDGTIATDGSEDVSPSPYLVRGNYRISAFCAYTALGTSHCYTDDGVSNDIINVLSVRFMRPNPDALFVTNVSPLPQYTSACIEVKSPTEDTRTVEITNTGQIAVGGSGDVCDD